MNLSHDPSDLVRRLIIQLGQGTLPTQNGSWPVFVFNEPDSPDNCTTVYNTEGIVNSRLQVGRFIEYPSIQIRVRGIDAQTSWNKIQAITYSIEGAYNVTVSINSSSYLIQSLNKKSGVIFGGKDSPSSKRSFWTVNYSLTLKQL